MSKPVKTPKHVKAGGKPTKVAKHDKPTKTEQTTLKGKLKTLGYTDATLTTIIVDGDDLGTIADKLILTQRNAPKG